MTTAQNARTGQAQFAATGSAFGRWTANLREAWSRHRAYAETLAELQALTDRELADIGVSRVDLRRIARESVYG